MAQTPRQINVKLVADVRPFEHPLLELADSFGALRGVQNRFKLAFYRELDEHPGVPPRPTALARRMGWKNRNLRGSVTILRRQMLQANGFVKDEQANRWRLA